MKTLSENTPVSQLVVIGASAGGIEALCRLVSTLSKAFPAPLVIAQHLDPTRPSSLGEILARRTELSVVNVVDKVVLRQGTIYVVPSNQHVEIDDHAISLHSDGMGRPKPSIDLLLTSAASVFGEQLIAVILTGLGSDGTDGARMVKQMGGTVIIQDPNTAAYPEMPRSLEPQTVDIVANLERIGPILFELLTEQPPAPAQNDPQARHTLLEEIHEVSGIDFSNYRPATLDRRLQRRLIATNTENISHYRQYLKSHPDEYQRLISSFLIKVTEFMRDAELFAALQAEILPELLAEARQRGNELRIWSAGCATGEEAYSIAILLCELLGENLDQQQIKIFATDLDTEAVAFARRGIYRETALSNLPQPLISRYFTQLKGSYTIKKQVRNLIVFGEHDLSQRAPFPQTDLILCRNVLIYFSKELQKRILRLFAFSLRNGGLLVLGKAETVSPLDAYFAPHDQLKIYRRQGDRLLIPPPWRDTRTSVSPAHYAHLPESNSRSLERYRMRNDLRRSFGLSEQLLFRLPLGVIVIDQNYDIQEINTAARQLLAIHTPAIGEDLLHLIDRVVPREVRTVIDQAIQERIDTTTDGFPMEQLTTGEVLYLQLDCYPQPSDLEDGQNIFTLILVKDVSQNIQRRQQVEADIAIQTARSNSLAKSLSDVEMLNVDLSRRNEQLQQELAKMQENYVVLGQTHRLMETSLENVTQRLNRLTTTNRELVAANEQLTQTMEELRSGNEEFLLANEESQAALEEVETLNEEIQATNEELETLNEQLQSTIEELNTSNADQTSMNQELQGIVEQLDTAKQEHDTHNEQHQVASSALQAEKQQSDDLLDGILATWTEAVVIVSPNGAIQLANAAYSERLGAANILFEDEQGRPLAAELHPMARVARGEAFHQPYMIRVADGTTRLFKVSGQPLCLGERLVGGLLVIHDVAG